MRACYQEAPLRPVQKAARETASSIGKPVNNIWANDPIWDFLQKHKLK
jgi:hypothetical protein